MPGCRMQVSSCLASTPHCKEMEIQQLRDKQKRLFETSGLIQVNSYHSCYSTDPIIYYYPVSVSRSPPQVFYSTG